MILAVFCSGSAALFHGLVSRDLWEAPSYWGEWDEWDEWGMGWKGIAMNNYEQLTITIIITIYIYIYIYSNNIAVFRYMFHFPSLA